ncbi:MAG: DUF4159 domain-containing protein [Phycisphaerae bacterium]
MRIALVPLIVAAVCTAVVTRPVFADVDNAKVEAAIKKAKAYLYAKMSADGTWETGPAKFANNNQHDGGQWGGLTALCTYALLAAGESPQDAKLAKAIAFLKTADIRGTYARGIRMLVWHQLPESKETLALMKVDAQLMLDATRGDGNSAGMHDYTGIAGSDYSHSRSQYAVLGLWAAEQLNVEVPGKYWEYAEAGWLRNQDKSGGWTYKHPSQTEIPPTPGMTAAGVASLFITQDYLHAGKAAECRGVQNNPAQQAIDRGVEWLSKHMDMIASDKTYARSFHHVTLYAVERVGVAGGLKFFGTADWYDKGANWLVKKQKPDGSWLEGAGGALFTAPVDTAFSLLFLVRGRAPVAIAKLDYSSDPKKPVAWNQRPRDVANAVRYVGRSLERDLNWQVVNLKVEATELLDAPVLYLSGSQPLALTEEQIGKLRAYAEMGGIIMGHADCGNALFAKSFRELGSKLFPKYEFRELPAGHILYNNNYKHSNWKIKPAIQGLSNGARELMLLVHSGDPARLWQIRAIKGREEPWQFATNLFLYTSDRKDLRYKGDTYWVTVDPKAKATKKLSVARLEIGEDSDPEPGGWRRMAAILQNRHGVEVTVKTVKPGGGALTAAAYPVAHLTGTAKFRVTDEQTAELKKYVADGGMLIIDAAGGSAEFADAAEPLAKLVASGGALGQLPPTHAIYLGADGQPIATLWRPFAAKSLARSPGRIMAAPVEGKPGVVFSREDLSVGLVGQHVDGVYGYSPVAATAIVERLLMTAVGGATAKPAATEKPAATDPEKKPATPTKPKVKPKTDAKAPAK